MNYLFQKFRYHSQSITKTGRIHFLDNFPDNDFPDNDFPDNDFPDNDFPDNDFPDRSLSRQFIFFNYLT
jgi:hypothetical protein